MSNLSTHIRVTEWGRDRSDTGFVNIPSWPREPGSFRTLGPDDRRTDWSHQIRPSSPQQTEVEEDPHVYRSTLRRRESKRWVEGETTNRRDDAWEETIPRKRWYSETEYWSVLKVWVTSISSENKNWKGRGPLLYYTVLVLSLSYFTQTLVFG